MSPAAAELNIAVLPGDGIGVEVTEAALAVLDAAQAIDDAPRLRTQRYAAGALHYANSGEALPAATLSACEKADAVLFGAMGWPAIRYTDGTEIAPQLDLRMALDLYAGVRPIRAFRGLPPVLRDERAAAIDFVLIREQTEGLFYSRGRGVVIDEREATDTLRITRAGTERVCEFAFRLAAVRRERGFAGRVCCVDKANVFASMAFFRRVFDEVAARHPALGAEHAYIDAMALDMVRQPWRLDVLVTENQFGDILSDLAAGLIGGMGMAPSADLGDKYGLFQPAHGSAPDIAGRGIANPSAMFLSAAMMLDWLGQRHAAPGLTRRAAMLEAAVQDTLASGLLPAEFGGRAGTADITRAVIAALPSALRRLD